MLKKWLLILIPCFQLQAQTGPCVLKEATVFINFGAGDAAEVNFLSSAYYQRVESPCPTDGHYTYASYTSNCFRGDWITLEQDHTPGDKMGNMLLVNSSYQSGKFFTTIVLGLKPGINYEFAVWMLNVCKPTNKCPFPLLPNITIKLETMKGGLVSQLNTGDIQRYGRAQWTKYSAMFTMPKGTSNLVLSMINHAPGGCGNDFAVDDITFRECVPPPPVAKKANAPLPKGATSAKTPVKKDTTRKNATVVTKPASKPANKSGQPAVTAKKENATATETVTLKKTTTSRDSAARSVKMPDVAMPALPPPLRTRTNTLVKRIETNAGKIRVDLYDNGEIDDDTVSIYHNNILALSRARLSQNPITIHIDINESAPHHELVMVANNLGSIPPNTSLMIVQAGSQRYEVFISSSEQNNAKVVFDLKK